MTLHAMTILWGIEVALIVGTKIAWELWKSRRQKKISMLTEKKIITEVLIFSEESTNCRSHANRKIPCSIKCPIANIKRLIYYLDSTSKTLDVSMYIMTCQDLTEAIIKAHERKVIVRVIVDASMFENRACYDQLVYMKRNSIKVRMQRSNTSLMHHKFAIIDREIMIYGSTNWTMQAFYGNFDGTLVTNQPEFVTVFTNEFDRMWDVMQ